jgi:PTS system nitrogen regulatory IIA component
MTLDALLPMEHVVAKLRAGDKGRLLTDLAGRVATLSGIPAADIIAALLARERLGSTGVGNGIAMPHARLEGLSALFGLFAKLDRAVDYDAIDGRPVDLVFLLLSPAQGTNDHLAALAAVSRRLRDRATADEIRGARDAEQIRAALVR